jgi:tetratricopeptide (TPR) repeat protein
LKSAQTPSPRTGAAEAPRAEIAELETAALNNQGTMLLSQVNLAEAEHVLAEGLAACRRVFAGPHPKTAMLLHHHADALRALGRLDDAAAEARAAMDMYNDHPDWAVKEAVHAATVLASILTAQGRPDEALAARREGLAIQRRTLPPGSAELVGQLAAFGLDLLKLGTLDAAREAEPLLRECLEIRLKTIPDDWRVPNTRSLLGGSILLIADLDPALAPSARAARLREAESLLLDGYTALKDNPGVPSPAQIGADPRREALERVVHLYEVWDRADPGKGYDAKVAEWKAKLEPTSTSTTGNQP